MKNLGEVLARLADRHGVSLEPGTIRARQVSAWIREFPVLAPSQAEAVWNSVNHLDSWPKFGEIARAVQNATRIQPGAAGEKCPVCLDSGWVGFSHNGAPWAAACLCGKGRFLSSPRPRSLGMITDPVVVQPVDRELYDQRLRQAAS